MLDSVGESISPDTSAQPIQNLVRINLTDLILYLFHFLVQQTDEQFYSEICHYT